MRTIIAAIVLTVAAPAAAAADKSLTAPITAFIDAFDKGDMKAVLATYATGDIAIVDEFPPHYWFGPNAVTSFATDFGKYAAAKGQTGAKVVLGAPLRSEVGTGVAYVIMAARYSFTEHAVPMVEDGQMTFALKGKAGSWKIAAWTWTGPAPRAAR